MNERFQVSAVWPWYPYDGRLGGFRRGSRRGGKMKNPWHKPELEAWSSNQKSVALLPDLFRLIKKCQ
jgi:hypothetical protein